jgi:hypothetical protein
MRVLRLTRSALLALIVAGCGPPTIYDVDGRPVKEPAYIARVDGGLVAVDSGPAGIRAVLELQVPTAGSLISQWDVDMPVLRLGSGRLLSPVRVQQSAPHCWPSIPQQLRCGQEQGETKYCVRVAEAAQPDCQCTLRAEFVLLHWPQPSDLVLLGIGDSLAVAQLAVVESRR